MAASCDNQVAMVTNKLEAELVRKITDSAIKVKVTCKHYRFFL